MFWFRNEEELYEEGRPIEEQYLERILPVKLDIAMEYSRRRTFYSDLEIIFRTILGLQAPFATGIMREQNRSAPRAFLSVLRGAPPGRGN